VLLKCVESSASACVPLSIFPHARRVTRRQDLLPAQNLPAGTVVLPVRQPTGSSTSLCAGSWQQQQLAARASPPPPAGQCGCSRARSGALFVCRRTLCSIFTVCGVSMAALNRRMCELSGRMRTQLHMLQELQELGLSRATFRPVNRQRCACSGRWAHLLLCWVCRAPCVHTVVCLYACRQLCLTAAGK
jgi:hypothetical protein